jgi:hypothetical protein
VKEPNVENDTPPNIQPLAPKQTLELSIEQFNSIPARRVRYMMLYVVAFLIWLSIFTFFWTTVQAPDSATSADTPEAVTLPAGIIALQVLTGICLLLFYVQFVNVLRIMGYPIAMIACTCLAVFLPIPGLIVVAYVDRRIIAKAWNKAKQRLDEQQDPLA